MDYGYRKGTLYDLMFKQKSLFVDIFLMGFSVFLLGVMANIRIPIWPVPITMQTFGVFLVAFFFGSRKGLLTLILYLIVGVLGFGIFSGYNSGIGTLLGPTGGYIIGFLFCVFFVGRMIEKGYGRDKKSIILLMVIGSFIIYTFGLLGLWFVFGNIGFIKILQIGLLPFLIGDLLKILLAIGLFPMLWNKAQDIA